MVDEVLCVDAGTDVGGKLLDAGFSEGLVVKGWVVRYYGLEKTVTPLIVVEDAV